MFTELLHDAKNQGAGTAPLRVDVFAILRPIGWVVFDVTPDGVHFAVVADDTLIVIPLPEFGDDPGAGQGVNLFGGLVFEIGHNLSQGLPALFLIIQNIPALIFPARNKGRGDRAPTVVEDDNSVNMVGHDDKRAGFDAGEMDGNVIPPFLDDFAGFIQNHLTIDNLPE